VITITGFGDHNQPEWLIIFTGIRTLIKYEPLLYREGSKYAHLNVRASPTRNRAEVPSSQTERVLSNTQQHPGVGNDSQAVS